jgi:antitoxin MazE
MVVLGTTIHEFACDCSAFAATLCVGRVSVKGLTQWRRSHNMKARLKVTAYQGKLAIDLPAAMAGALELQAGDEVEVEIVRTAPVPTVDRSSLVSLRRYRGRLPATFKFDRHDANAR